ncbi:hypothetical protein HanXRQr2_Chr16g0732201 [Helianthus annuus]|uniref:Uncharacterized protein n=1 Tax=Helianthus annuus TaxID=4232 RepID=A0A9K3DN83_HELAN|nr:hypothetical protein HanXRQr2_Chr16g0732201 [Helianthus annuus]KAJ0819962.1 hypothetical protein HanPSC8_Chr16g0702191 [Helianthus annuus]
MFRVLKIMNYHPAITRICGMMIKNPKQYKFSSMRIIETMKTKQFAFQMMKIMKNQRARIKICGIPETIPVHQNDEKKAICVSDDENYEPAACSNIPKRSFMDSGFNKMDCVGDKDRSNTKISGSSGEVEVVALFTPSPEYRNRKKRAVSVVCPEIIDLTESPICVFTDHS